MANLNVGISVIRHFVASGDHPSVAEAMSDRGDAMTSGQQQYWFPAKRYGWGWDLPCARQGWVILLGYFAAVLEGCLWILPSYGAGTFVANAALLTAVLLAVCWAKGERPRWRWGED